jgi:hypothetical protein
MSENGEAKKGPSDIGEGGGGGEPMKGADGVPIYMIILRALFSCIMKEVKKDVQDLEKDIAKKVEDEMNLDKEGDGDKVETETPPPTEPAAAAPET